ncbi:MAG: helix-turn-helix transcriptional regulator [Planctomycetes bacterium]|nr:helix-turn-helix transcriptional regulator [Planctomycetota bacterium]
MQKRNPDAATPGVRLRWLVEQHSQAAIARKAGVPPPTVYRYLKGAKIPADFCAALVRQFDVNPAWFLVGEGTPYLSDISAGNAAMAGDLLAVVEAMNAVSKMRLGTLAGKGHLRVLRELDDAMRSHEELKERVNKSTRPIFAQLVDDLQAALNAHDRDQAEILFKAAMQVSRLCEDESLQIKFLGVRTRLEYVRSNHELSIKVGRERLLRTMAAGEGLDVEVSLAASELIVAMRDYRMSAEGARFCRAMLDFDEGRPEIAAMRARLWNLLASLQLDLDDLAGAWVTSRKMLERPDDKDIELHAAVAARLMLYGGMARPLAALKIGEQSVAKSRRVMRFAGWLEDETELREVLELVAGKGKEWMSRDDREVKSMGWVAEALRGNGEAALAAFCEHEEGLALVGVNRASSDFARAVRSCQLARLAGLRKQAIEFLREADDQLARIPARYTTAIEHRGTLHRSAVLLLGDSKRDEDAARVRKARAFFVEKVAAGFACFRPMLETKTPGG